MNDVRWTTIGKARALIRPEEDSKELRAFISHMPDSLSSAKILQAGRHITACLTLPESGVEIVIKKFGSQVPLKDIYDRFNGTKAYRTFAAASFMKDKGIGTIPPVACVEEWHGAKLASSCFISRYLRGTVCLKDQLADVWRKGGIGMDKLLAAVANGIRELHDSGCTHGDLGNQNIELVIGDSNSSFNGIAFLDLNRARFGKKLTISERAADLVRISLPYGLYDDFFRFYWNGEIPEEFLKAYWRHRWFFHLHGRTRNFRHPFRELKYKRHPETAPAQVLYPRPITVSSNIPEGKYTDSRALPLTREQVLKLPHGSRIYFFNN